MNGMKEILVFVGGCNFMKSCNSFKKDAVDKWNCGLSEVVTKSLFLSVVGIDEGERKGAGTITLDLLLKGGTLKESNMGSWDLEEGYDKHRNYIFGNRKTIECINLFFLRHVKENQISRSHLSSWISSKKSRTQS